MSDRLVGALFAAVAVWYGYTAQSYVMAFTDPLGPSAFPIVLAVPLGILSLYLLARPDPDPDWAGGRRLAKQCGAVALLICYSQALAPLGFVISTIILATLLSMLLGARLWAAAANGLVLAVGFFFLFDSAFQLPLPSGTLFGG